jgi:hypothetical protein
MDAPLKKFSP